MSTVFGIDLGTTYSAISRIDEFGQPIVILNEDNQPTTPSVVFFESATNVVVGAVAKNTAKITPESVVSLVKRQMGQATKYDFFDTVHSPESISAIILRHLVDMAVEESGIDSNQVVITVPAYFGTTEKDATRKAGEIAGLDVIAIVPEPVAAAFAYGLRQDAETDKTVFIYDLGGGTFDTTILKITPGALTTVVIGGDHELGGADWDTVLQEYVLAKFIEQAAPDGDPSDDEIFLQSLADDIENAKKYLSRASTRKIQLSYGAASATIELTQQELEDVTRPLLKRTVDVVRRTLESAQAKEPGLVIDELLLVGGSSRMPAVARILKEEFGWDGQLKDPDLSVAKGAAIYAVSPSAYTDASDDAGTGTSAERFLPGSAPVGSERTVHNVLPRGFGILFADGDTHEEYISHFVHANDSLPAFPDLIRASTLVDGQTELALRLFEQDSPEESTEVSSNREVTPDGGLTFTGLPRLPKGSPVEITVSVSHEGVVQVSATMGATGQTLEAEVQIGVLQQDEVNALRKTVSGLTVSA